MLLIFVQLCPLLSQPALELSSGNRTQWNGREGFLLPSIDDREEGRLSTFEVPVGDTGKKGARA